MAPYRSQRESEAPKVAPKTGLVAEMVRQFADPYAFLRELVQNGIDAGATALEVMVERSVDGIVTTSVTDDGCGMSRDVIEGPLLTLFSSSKEGQTGKIGKYGVGFVSVFALEPDEVQVTTWRGGACWILRLFKDHSYELSRGAPRSGSGTTVALIKQAAAGQERSFADHEALALEALRTWCRHAACPVTLKVVDRGVDAAAQAVRATRIDAPLSVWSAVSVLTSVDDESFIAGPSAGAEILGEPPANLVALEERETFAGFYNRGLTLFETDQPLAEELRGIRFKVMSPHLQHTLSRDNVRRDEAFGRVLDQVRGIVSGALRSKVLAELARFSDFAAKGEHEREHAARLKAALSPAMAPSPRQIAFPLTDPVGGEVSLKDVRASVPRGEPLLVATGPDALTAALAAEGRHVLRCSNDHVASAISACFQPPVEKAHSVYGLVREVADDAWTEEDRLLCRELAQALAAAEREVGRVGLCAIEGAGADRTAVLVPSDREQGPRILSIGSIEELWRRWGKRRALLLNVGSAMTALARKRAKSDCVTSAGLLARVLLLEAGGALSARVNEQLLEHAGKGLG